MNGLIRMAYGHGGTKLKRVQVAGPQAETADPLWLKLVFMAVCIAVPLLVCRFSLPRHTQSPTVIDFSRLKAETPPAVAPESPIAPEPPRPKPVEPLVSPPAQTARKPIAEAPPEEMKQLAITRPATAGIAEVPQYQPRIRREHLRVGTESSSPAETRIRHDRTAAEAPSEPTAITRTRAAADVPVAKGGVPTLRRAATAEGGSAATGVTVHPIARRERTTGLSGTMEGGVPRPAAARERRETAVEGDGGTARAVGLARGVSLESLDICATPQAQEDAIKAVLGVVGSQQSCRNETGEYQLKGTKRVSSFNLIIHPAPGRRPTNKCEELQNAYSCLTQ